LKIKCISKLRFGINEKEFNFLTFKEFIILSKIWDEDKSRDIKDIYELIRLQTYILLSPHTKRGFNWNNFIKDMMPFHWDDKDKKTSDLENLTEEEWGEFEASFKKEGKVDKIIPLETIDKIKM